LGGGHSGQQAQSAHQSARYYAGDKRRGHQQPLRQQDPCQIFSPQQPIPQGCNPSQVTLGTAGGFPQQPNFGGGYGHEYASQGFGSHADVAGQQAAHYQPKGKIRKPRLRASLSLGIESSYSGNLLDYSRIPSLDPVAGYNPQDFNEGSVSGSAAGGNITQTTYTANDQPGNITSIFTPNSFESASAPDISFDDVHSTPLRLAAGAEYIFSPRTTVFGNAGYSYAEGNNGQTASVNATLYREVASQSFIDDPANPGTSIPNGPPIINTTFIPNQQIARFSYDFTDLERIDLEAGVRHYFNPIGKSHGYKTLTPFVSASAGASYLNAVSLDVSQEQLFYERAFESGGTTADFFSVTGPTTRVDLYDSQWVPSGQLNAGMEWQVTPKTALALETGVRIEGARDYSNGERGDTNVVVPLTLRGSFNF